MCFKKSLITFSVIFTLGLASLFSCSELKDANAKHKKYSIYVMAKDYKEYIVHTDDISTGQLHPIEEGIRVFPKQIWYDLIVKNGFYYRLDRKTQYFIKSTLKDNSLQAIDSVMLSDFVYLDNYSWIHTDSLFLISHNRKLNKLQYAKVNVIDMQAQVGILPLPKPSGIYNSISVGFSNFLTNQLFVGYTYHSISSPQNYRTSDTAFVSLLTYPALKLLKTQKDTRSTYPGGNNTAQPNTFTDLKGDFYFLSCPGIALGNNPNKPTGIFRILKGQQSLDKDYFFNISASIKNHAYGMWDIGNNKAIIRSERKDLFTGFEDHYVVPHVEFYVVDLIKQTVKKLGLPLDKGTSRRCVLVENGLVYISLNSDSGGNNIWVYNPKDESLKKGLQLDGSIDYILRIEKLYEN